VFPETEEASLLNAVVASPFDDAPALVYADWLLEHGDEPRSEYLRGVVRLAAEWGGADALARLVAVAENIDPAWRHKVGARFEVVLEGAAGLLLIAHLFQAVLNIAFKEAFSAWQTGEPVRLKTQLTPEEASAFIQCFGPSFAAESPRVPDLRLRVRTMDGPAIGLFAADRASP
jgi:uncharacterized protein (TIGR02996 family)